MNGWSDWKKWWLDLLKFSITFIVASSLTILVIEQISLARQKAQLRWQLEHQLKAQALVAFGVASQLHLQAMDDAFLVAFRGRVDLSTHLKDLEEATKRRERLTPFGERCLSRWRCERMPQLEASLTDVAYLFAPQAQQIARLRLLLAYDGELMEELRRMGERGDLDGNAAWREYRSEDGVYGRLRKRYVDLVTSIRGPAYFDYRWGS